MNLIRKHTGLAILGAVVLLLIVIITGSVLGGEATTPVGKFFQGVVTTVQKPFVALGNGVSGLFTDDKLKAENEELKARVSELERELVESGLDETELAELRALRDSFGEGSATSGKYTLKAANVLSFDGSNSFTVFTIDIGTETGVKRDTVVVTGDGLVGRVYETGKGWSKVVSVISDSNNIGFQVYPELKFIGICRGDGKERLAGELFDEEAQVQEGSEILTSGIGGVYPSGLKIGTITKVEHEEGGSLLTVEIEPSVYFKGLKKVAVLL